MLRLAHGISMVLLATLTAPVTSTGALATESARACEPQIHLLPPLEGDTDSRLSSMNTRGWAVGTSQYFDPATGRSGRPSSVLWRDGVTLDLHAGGAYDLFSEPVDINRQGVVAVQRFRARRSGRLIPATSWTWRNGKMDRLRGGQMRRAVYVEALSDVALDDGPFFHGTKADLRAGDLLTAGFRSNYRPEVVMNHIYFTALPDGAGLAAELAAGEGAPRVYEVVPVGAYGTTPTERWQNIFGVAVIREVTSLAPRGGVSIGGTADASSDTGFDRATIWTCAQTY